VVEVLWDTTDAACGGRRPTVLVAAASRATALRRAFDEAAPPRLDRVRPPTLTTTDNAAMIGKRPSSIRAGEFASLDLNADASLKLRRGFAFPARSSTARLRITRSDR
jgi:tRNA A37 threonylcarbamoyltransferase TsaD